MKRNPIVILLFSLFSYFAFAQELNRENEIREMFSGYKDFDAIQNKIQRTVRELTQFIDVEEEPFKNKQDVLNSLSDTLSLSSVYSAEPFLGYETKKIKEYLQSAIHKNYFSQHLNSNNISYIDHDINSHYILRKEYPYLIKSIKLVNITEKEPSKEIIYFDKEIDKITIWNNEIPSSKLIDSLLIEIKEEYNIPYNITLTKEKPDYKNEEGFVSLINLKGNIAKLWATESFIEAKGGTILVTTKSDKVLKVNSFSEKKSRLTDELLVAIRGNLEVLRTVDSLIDKKEFVNKEQLNQYLLKNLPLPPANIRAMKQFALSLKTEEDIKKIEILIPGKNDSVAFTATLINRDRMSKKLGFRVYGRDQILDNFGNVITTVDIPSLEQEKGIFFTGKEHKDDKIDKNYIFNLESKTFSLSPYDSYVTGMGFDKDYDYDFILVRDSVTSLTGVLNLKGKVIIPPNYKYIEYDPHDQLFSPNDEEYKNYNDGVVNREGKTILTEKYGLIMIKKYFITAYDKQSKEKLFNKEGNSLLKNGWKLGCYYPQPPSGSARPEFFISPEIEGSKALEEPLALVSDSSGPFFINNEGQVVIKKSPNYKFHGDFSDGFALVKNKLHHDGTILYGYIDSKGKLVIPMIYSEAGHFVDGFAEVKKNGKTFYINKKNKTYQNLPDKKEGRNSLASPLYPTKELGF